MKADLTAWIRLGDRRRGRPGWHQQCTPAASQAAHRVAIGSSNPARLQQVAAMVRIKSLLPTTLSSGRHIGDNPEKAAQIGPFWVPVTPETADFLANSGIWPDFAPCLWEAKIPPVSGRQRMRCHSLVEQHRTAVGISNPIRLSTYLRAVTAHRTRIGGFFEAAVPLCKIVPLSDPTSLCPSDRCSFGKSRHQCTPTQRCQVSQTSSHRFQVIR